MTRKRSALTTQFQITGVTTNGVGTGNDACWRWTTVTPTGPTNFYTVVDSVANGGSFALNVPGAYTATFGLAQVASSSLLMGIALGGTAAFDANPVVGTNGVIATRPITTLPAATLVGAELTVSFTLGDSQMDGVANLVRFLSTDGSNATPVASTTQASAWFRIVQFCDKAQ